MKKRATLLLILLSFGLVFGACASESSVNEIPDRAGATESVDTQDADDVAIAEPEGEADAKKVSEPTANQQVASTNDGTPVSGAGEEVPIPKKRMIQRDGRFTLESSDPVKAQRAIEKAVQDSKGFVIESNRRISSGEIRGIQTVSMTLRVPAEKFDGSLERIRKAGDRVISEQVKGKDVTKEYVDLQARLKAKRALEAQFLEIMKQAKTVQDAMNVQRQIAGVRSEIERIEGQKRLLESLTSMSTIRVTINPPNSVSSSGTGFWYELQDAVGDGLEFALNSILVLVRVVIALLPVFIIFVLPLALIIRWLWGRVKRNRLAREIIREAEEESDDNE